MNPQKADKLLRELKEEVTSLEQAAVTAQHRKEVASIEADNLENRNKIIVESIEQEVSLKKKKLLAEVDEESKALETEIGKLRKVKLELQDKIESLAIAQTELLVEVDGLEAQKKVLENELLILQAKLQENHDEIAQWKDEIRGLQAKKENLEQQIAQLVEGTERINEDLSVLEAESTKLEDQIIEQDTIFKTRKETFEKQLSDLQLKLKNAVQSLEEAQAKDKAMRQAWAEEHFKLEKRTVAVHKMEARVAGAEKRVEELDTYMKL